MRDANTTTAAGADTRSEAEPGRRRAQARPGEDVLDGLTAEQTPCVEHVDGPLVVSAGAGSGKTFMLTRRIAYALLHPEKSGVTSVDQILAITFTELAASQIKARTRSMLTSLGMQDQALKVDSSWISTIHGACSRILHEQALGLGLDPAFGILDDARKDALVQESINEALEAAGLLERPSARSEDGAPVAPAHERGDDDAMRPGAVDGADAAGAGGVDRSFADLYREYGSSSRHPRAGGGRPPSAPRAPRRRPERPGRPVRGRLGPRAAPGKAGGPGPARQGTGPRCRLRRACGRQEGPEVLREGLRAPGGGVGGDRDPRGAVRPRLDDPPGPRPSAVRDEPQVRPGARRRRGGARQRRTEDGGHEGGG
jgi:hypothetical protein